MRARDLSGFGPVGTNGPQATAVDVLAVMDRELHWFTTRERQASLFAARVAMAELIAADKEYDAAKEDLATQRRQVGAIEAAEVRFRKAEARRRAALARCTGGSQ